MGAERPETALPDPFSGLASMGEKIPPDFSPIYERL